MHMSLADTLKRPIVLIAVLGLAIRLVLVPLFTYNVDMAYWVKALEIPSSGLPLYDVDGYYYTPVWGYILSLVSYIGTMIGIADYGTIVTELLPYTGRVVPVMSVVVSPEFAVLIKIPLIIADLLVGWVLYRFVKKITDDEKKSVLAFAVWFLCPLVIIESSVHGMFDNISALMLLLAFVFAYDKKYVFAGSMYVTAILTKFFPVYFLPFFIAMVLKREGFSKEGIVKLLHAVAGGIVAFCVIELPAVLQGEFWNSVHFLTDRLGLKASTLIGIFDSWTKILIFIIILVAIIAIVFFIGFRYKTKFKNFMDKMNRNECVKAFLAIFGLCFVIAAILIAFSALSGSAGVDIVTDSGMKVVAVASVAGLVFNAFLAGKMLSLNNMTDKAMFTILMISSMMIFLWPPAPQYIVVILPILGLYVAICDMRLFKPYLLLTVSFTLYELILGNVSCLFTISEYFGVPDTSFITGVIDFLNTQIMGIEVIGILMAVFGMLAYLTIFYFLYRWYMLNKEEIPDETLC